MGDRKPGEAGKKERHLTLPEQLLAQAIGNDEVVEPDDQEAKQKWPTLYELLTFTGAGTQHVITPAKLTIAMGIGLWSVTLTLSDLKRKFEATSGNLGGCFDAFEKQVNDPAAPWKTWGKGEMKVKRRKEEKKA